jgi:type VI secretion system protein ImpL
MKKILGLIFNRWVFIALLLITLSLLIWIVGPLVAIADARPLETEFSRWMAIGVLVLLVVAIVAWKQWRARRGNAAVVKQLLAPAATGGGKEADSPDLVAVRQRFEQALQTLRRSRFGKQGLLSGWAGRLGGQYLYELPWYLIIGAPGSGKTTALHNCGLRFPLAQDVGDHAVRGVGGTRHCDWWFTDKAVLLDTAGRFTTQDSDRENDRATWGGFLGLLKKARPRQPVNGVLVTVSITDLLTRSANERRQHAATVRQRLQELHQDLGLRFPIYLLVTKSDLLAGFMDYFSMLDKDQRATPWGMTFALADSGTTALQRFGPEFDALLHRLNNGLVERLQSERDPLRRARVYGFPGQFAGLRGVVQEFLDTVFSPSPYEAQPMLRGVYFVSGTQEGTPIDRVLGAVARSYRLERAVISPNQSSGKSYFLSRLLGEVVFAESGLAGIDLKWERRRKALAIAGYAAVGVLTVGLVSAWTISYTNNRRYVDGVAQRVEDVRKLVQSTPNRASPDILPVVPALAATRALAGTNGDVPWKWASACTRAPSSTAPHARLRPHAGGCRAATHRPAVEEQLRQAGNARRQRLRVAQGLRDAARCDHFESAGPEVLRGGRLGHTARPFHRHRTARTTERAPGRPARARRRRVATARGQGPRRLPRQRLASVPLAQRVYNRMRHRRLGATSPSSAWCVRRATTRHSSSRAPACTVDQGCAGAVLV